MTKKLTVSNIEKVINYLKLNDKNCYWNYKGEVNIEDVTVIEDGLYSKAVGIVSGSEYMGCFVVQNGKALNDNSKVYGNSYNYIDKREAYKENGERLDIKDCSSPAIIVENISNAYIFLVYHNYNNNEVESYNLDYYYVK